QRAQLHAAAEAPGRNVRRVPLAHLGVRRREQLVDRRTERVGHLHQHREGWIALAGFQVGDGRTRNGGRSGQRRLRQRPRVAQADEIAREMRGNVIGCVHRFDLPPICWTTRLGPARSAPTIVSRKRRSHMAGTYNPEAPGVAGRDAIRSLRVALTGGTSGLGLALVHELVARGARVAFVARDRSRTERVAAASGANGIVGDVSRKEDIHPIALQAVGLLGGLDVLINNASSLGPVPLRPLGDTECEDLELALATNFVGAFRLTKALLGALTASARAGRGAVVLNVSSDAAISAYPGWGAYRASKAAARHLR